MKLLGLSTVNINCLKHAVLINTNDAEFICAGIGFSLDTHEIVIDLNDRDGEYYGTIPFSAIADWTIQLNSLF